MYKSFFGFKERPFQLVPNPAYLFLSRTHEEAMAHLTYALSQGDGFVELTGEVGTGKTTLCRSFLENLDEHTEAAYIFNPKLDSIQLLKTINQELGIPSEADNSKDLIDELNDYLLKKKVEGTKVVLVIDEAQNLGKEVLEQLRLLSNLETTTSKLLQIVLVGQPELGEMLDSPELRQLGQRITLSCNLHPLTFKETKEYIRHRIHVASQKPVARLTWHALRVIYRYSGGIPRLINIVCDRALLTAFGLNRKTITAGIARNSIRELSSRGDVKRFQTRKRYGLVAAAVCALLIAAFSWSDPAKLLSFLREDRDQERKGSVSVRKNIPVPLPVVSQATQAPQATQVPAAPAEKKEPEAPRTIATPPLNATEDLGRLLAGVTSRDSRAEAMKAALTLWSPGAAVNPFLDNMEDDQAFFRLAAKQNGLLVHRLEGEWPMLEKLNIPAIMEFRTRGLRGPRYLSLTRMEEGGVMLSGFKGIGPLRARPEDVKSHWSKVSYILWKDFLDYPGTIPWAASGESIIALKMLLQEIGFGDIEITPYYDEKAREAVMAVQEKNGIRVDGIVGPLTKIVLYKEKVSLKIPSIRDEKLGTEN
jgi:general secretion pathway protein A